MSRVTEESIAPRATSDAHAAPPTVTSRLRELIGRADGVLLGVVLVGAALRFWSLGAQSFWYDEWLTTEATSGGLSDVFRHAANREGIPPTYFVLMWGWDRVFGDGETALRTFSALVGIATIPVAYAIARQLGQRRTVARVAALLVAKPTTKPCEALVGRACALVFLGAPLPQPLASEFRLEAVHDLEQFTVERYRSSRPIPVIKADLVTPGDLPGALALVPRR